MRVHSRVLRTRFVLSLAVGAAALGSAAATTAYAGTTAQTKSPIKIGVILSLSGGQAAIGYDNDLGVKAGVDYINSHGGVMGRRFQIIALDNGNEPTESASDARELLQDHVTAIIGDMQTTTLSAELPLLNSAQMPTFTSATGSNLWGPGVNPYLFGTGDKSIYNALIDTEYLVNQLHIKKIGIIYQDDGFGDPSEAATVEVLKSLGLSPTGAEPFDPSATDVTAQLNSLESSGAKAVEAWTYGPGLVAVAKGMESIGWRPPTVTDTGLSQAAVVTGAGPSALTNFYGGPTVKNFLTERAGGQPAAATQTFMKYFRKVFGAGPFDGQQLAASSAYDAVVVLAQAIELAKSTSGPAIKKALEGGHIYIGARTTYRFSKAEHVGEAIVNLGMFKGGIACNLACVVAPGIKLAS